MNKLTLPPEETENRNRQGELGSRNLCYLLGYVTGAQGSTSLGSNAV